MAKNEKLIISKKQLTSSTKVKTSFHNSFAQLQTTYGIDDPNIKQFIDICHIKSGAIIFYVVDRFTSILFANQFQPRVAYSLTSILLHWISGWSRPE
jgi:hypothetical protein